MVPVMFWASAAVAHKASANSRRSELRRGIVNLKTEIFSQKNCMRMAGAHVKPGGASGPAASTLCLL